MIQKLKLIFGLHMKVRINFQTTGLDCVIWYSS